MRFALFFCFGFFATLFTSNVSFGDDLASALLPTIAAAKQSPLTAGEEITIQGSNFGGAPGSVQITVNQNGKEWTTSVVPKPEQWSDSEIVFTLPKLDGLTTATIHIKTSGGQVTKAAFAIDIDQENCNGLHYRYAKSAKESSFSESYIIDRLVKDKQKRKDDNSDYNDDFFTICEESKLKAIGYSEEFFNKIQNNPQYVTLGVSAVWLAKTAEFVPSPMLRIFLKPKSYYSPRFELFNLKTWGRSLSSRTDLNFGYSVIDSEVNKEQKTKYVLAGISFEVNKSALLNFGYARAVKDVDNDKGQLYVGLTVDFNFLKGLNIVAN